MPYKEPSFKLNLNYYYLKPILDKSDIIDKIEATDAEVLKHLTKLPELNNDWTEEKKLEIIKNVYRELSDSAYPVSIGMKKMQEIEEIRIIEGKQ